jgi:ornithine cyclodeaminase/alanine dehydrogenase-like protein (mu-crystallin family)
MLILTQSDVERLLPMGECIEVMASTLAALARGEALLPLRTMILIPDSTDVFAVMPGYLGNPSTIGAKIITFFPRNHGTKYDSHQGAVLLFDSETGSLAAILDATPVTTIRTAAVSAVATRLLSRPDSSTLAILGAGVQGYVHIEAIRLVRPIKRLHVWSRTREHAERLAKAAHEHFGLEATVADSGADAVRGADIVCTTTSAREPVLCGDWLEPGTHVNAIGASHRTAREVDSRTVVRSRLYVDRRESALKEPGDILVPLEDGDINADHIVAEVGELLIGRGQGRGEAQEITLFKSLGLAIEDLAAASHVLTSARRSGTGVSVELGGARHALF